MFTLPLCLLLNVKHNSNVSIISTVCQSIMHFTSEATMTHTSQPSLQRKGFRVVFLFIVVHFHTLLSSVWVLWWHGSSCQMYGWIRGVGCTLWQAIDVHAVGVLLPAMAPQHIPCQDHCDVSGSGQGSHRRHSSMLGTQFKPQDFDNAPFWTAFCESIKNVSFFFFQLYWNSKAVVFTAAQSKLAHCRLGMCVPCAKNQIYDGALPRTRV